MRWRDPWILFNLLIRIVLVAFAIGKGSYLLGDDSVYYLDSAHRVCMGDWGGDLYRMPFYMWYLCGLSAGGAALALIVQTLLIWGTGVFLASRFPRWIALIWLFDPVLLVYSNLVMTDAFFAVGVLLTALGIRKLLLEKEVRPGIAALTGLGMGVSILIRPIGMPLLAVTAPFFIFQLMRGKTRLAPILIFLSITGATLLPRLVWNGTQHQYWKLSSQGDNIMKAIAGIVEYTDQGLDFKQSETKWKEVNPNGTAKDAYRTLFAHLPKFAYLTTKGIGRVLIGHVNVEWGYLLTGNRPIGPGWFKSMDQGAGTPVKSSSIGIWLAGLVLFAGFALGVFFLLGNEIFRAPIDAFVVWGVLIAAILAIAPLVVGDARFRAPVVAALLAVAATRPKRVSDTAPVA